MSQLTVKLKPQTITENTVLGDFKTPIGQSQVWANGKVVGHICDPPEAPLNFCERLPVAVQKLIREEVAKLRGLPETVAGGSPPDPETVREIIRELSPPEDEDQDEDEVDESEVDESEVDESEEVDESLRDSNRYG
jgi:hypothetical protein